MVTPEAIFEIINAKPKIPNKLPERRDVPEFPRRLPERTPKPVEIPIFPEEIPIEPKKVPLRIPVPAR